MLKAVRLNKRKNSVASKISYGEQRKLCLAIALILNPKILVLDEPTTGLDPSSRRKFWEIIRFLKEERVIIVTTHFMEEADMLGDKISIMKNGELINDWKSKDISF